MGDREQQAAAASSTPTPPGSSIPYERFLDCVHCGLCTTACPTYVETGDENDGPRGRIYLMRAVADGRLELTSKVAGHLDLCLDCRSCETACPSGVQYGRLIEPFRVEMHRADATTSPDWFLKWIVLGLFPRRGRLQVALWPARIAQRLRIDRLVSRLQLHRLLPGRLRRMYEQLPQLRRQTAALPEFLPAKGQRRARVGLFTGCVADAMFRHVHWATARVLQENGCEVVIPPAQQCCGAIHYHNGAAEPAAALMQQNVDAFPRDLDAIVVNVAGCGSMLKDYSHIAAEIDKAMSAEQNAELSAFRQQVRDVNEFLGALGLTPPAGRLTCRVAYQDACHLQHAQRIHQQPRDLLEAIPGVTVVPIEEPELCCGAAGSYNLTQPEMADRLGQRKISHILQTQPDVIATANAGCSLQLQSQLRQQDRTIPVVHPMELLLLSYQQKQLQDLK